jgi:hypothetical protein
MNILIENDETLEFLTNAGEWKRDPRAGRRFESREAAVKAAKAEPIGRFNVVWHIPSSNQFVNLDHGRGKGAGEATPV